MNKDIYKYITNCGLCRWKKAKLQMYPFQVTDIQDWPFDKIAIDLITDLNVCMSGNQHILTIIEHLTKWLEAFQIPNKKVDTIVHIFINNYLPAHMWPRYILSDNGMQFKNQLMDNVLQQLGINHISSILNCQQSSRKLEVFHKYLKSILKKLCENDSLGPVPQPGTRELSCNSTPCHRWNNLLLCLGERPQSALAPTARTHAIFSWQSGFMMPKFRNALSGSSHI